MASQSEEKQPPAALKASVIFRLLLQVLFKVPLATRVAIWHLLRQSEQCKTQDLRTEVTVKVLKSFLTPSKPRPVSATQKFLGRDPGIKGRIWISTYQSPVPPESSVREALGQVIDGLKDAETADVSVSSRKLRQWEGEWTAYRPAAADDSTLPSISQRELYAEMMKDCTKPTTILYFHGGGYFVMDPATHRPSTKTLSKITGGRCYLRSLPSGAPAPFPGGNIRRSGVISYPSLPAARRVPRGCATGTYRFRGR